MFKKASVQHCIRTIVGEVVKARSVHLINFCGGGQVIASKALRFLAETVTLPLQENIKLKNF
ncbi:MAG: hypothetical protein HLUCCX10_14410 [Algoriphagus marincola HL-49]|uniref:Uncharacterized protein n=1 Tax=Algoriphagus marincola HL-49 TaxID=1305737 RepID=A0A0P8ACF3_9BACT|nr:MAG: hypothetical protein HLUCCX10_14410 [Algoriphagus marincola HL-49]